ncbi:Uncharacterised protein [uncultured Eubacterium sp.]|nr:Uncharacterised protein [uncultured Eubacterium sp.]
MDLRPQTKQKIRDKKQRTLHETKTHAASLFVIITVIPRFFRFSASFLHISQSPAFYPHLGEGCMQPALFTIKLGFLMLLQSSSRNSMAASAGVQTQYPPDFLQNLCLCAMWLLLYAANVILATGICTKNNHNQIYPSSNVSRK